MDPTNPLSVAPPRYKYQPNPETIARFPMYRSESDAESTDSQAEDEEHDQINSDEGSDFSDEEDRMPDLSKKETASYNDSDAEIMWRRGSDANALTQCGHVVIAVNHTAVILSQAFGNSSKAPASLQKVGHVVLQSPRSSKSTSRSRKPRKVFALWSIIPQGSTPYTLLAIQVARISDRAVYFVAKRLVTELTCPTTSASTKEKDVKILDSYIPQTYVDATQSSMSSDYPPIRYLATRKSQKYTADEVARDSSSSELARYESPNYVTGIGAGLLTCLMGPNINGSLLLLPKPIDRQSIIQAITSRLSTSSSDTNPAAEVIGAVLKGAAVDEEDLASLTTGSATSQRQRTSGRGKRDYGTIGDGGMYV
ncbi:hypothetical protein QFC22_002376 [Naganishia vaughanmartiniae]|uniref:Uncharacterized protein n=1 Tax=Naganishia vaughanmartiniae TaxID=1424756 RepID=A0ACC2XEE1_9TREE|nr:hypothetical protein QFC22_002376 [Naganishia vaughanmartiniae]